MLHVADVTDQGRLLYTTGDTEGAVRYFLGLLRGTLPHLSLPPPRPLPGLGLTDGDALVNSKILQAPADKMYLEDFRVALKVRGCMRLSWPEFSDSSSTAFQMHRARALVSHRAQAAGNVLPG